METEGNTISVELIDGDSEGWIKCEIKYWTGLVYKIPRAQLKKHNDIQYLYQNCVYFLLGRDNEKKCDFIYVGQAAERSYNRGISDQRMQEHIRKNDVKKWTEVIILTTSDNTLGSTELDYLEYMFYETAKNANRYDVRNKNTPHKCTIKKDKQHIDDFIKKAKNIVSVLGYKPFVPLNESQSTKSEKTDTNFDDAEILHLKREIKNVGRVDASCIQTDEGFVVLKGSVISLVEGTDIPNSVKEKRKTASVDKEGDTIGILKEDILLTSASAAAKFVIGKMADGLTDWKNESNQNLKLLKQKKGKITPR